MIVRGIDTNNDWLFGKGRNDYKTDLEAVAQNIKTRLQSFVNDCFWDMSAGVDWFELLGSRRVLELRLSISTVILNTQDVKQINVLSSNLDDSRNLLIQYSVETEYGTVEDVLTSEVISA